MTQYTRSEIRAKVCDLRAEHRQLDLAIMEMEMLVYCNQLELRRLKTVSYTHLTLPTKA